MHAQESARIKVLLLSDHVPTVETVCHVLHDQAVHVEPCCGSDTALGKLCRFKYEGLIVDLGRREEALQVLRTFRSSTSHRNAISFAVLNNNSDKCAAFDAGANFVFGTPLSTGMMTRTLRAAYPMLVREKRRHFSYPIQVRVQIRKKSGHDFQADAVNVSEVGMAVNSPTPLQIGERIQIRLPLPGTTTVMQVEAETCWADSGRAGLQFCNLSHSIEQSLQSWLANRLQELILAVV